MGEFLTVGGIVIQLVGGLVALRGLIKTHDAYAEKSIRTIVTEWLARVRAQIDHWIARLLRRRRGVVVATGGGTVKFNAGGAQGMVGWGPLPQGTAEAIAELDRRTRELSTRIDRLDQRIGQTTDEARAALERLRSDLLEASEKANLLIRQAAIEGLMGEAIGLLLVIVGGMLQAWGALIPAPPPVT